MSSYISGNSWDVSWQESKAEVAHPWIFYAEFFGSAARTGMPTISMTCAGVWKDGSK